MEETITRPSKVLGLAAILGLGAIVTDRVLNYAFPELNVYLRILCDLGVTGSIAIISKTSRTILKRLYEDYQAMKVFKVDDEDDEFYH
jgi:sensor histidine kinase YesM